MTLIKAMQSERPFRRKKWSKQIPYIFIDPSYYEFLCSGTLQPFRLSPKDIIAEDWETYKEP